MAINLETTTYQILFTRDGQWQLNEEGDVLLIDKDTGSTLWVPPAQVINNLDINESNFSESLDIDTMEEDSNNLKGGSHEIQIGTKRSVWDTEKALFFITLIESRYEDMFDLRKKVKFWTVIAEEMNSEGLTCTDKECKKKWLNLVRTYKNVKDTVKKSGRGPTKFQFFSRMDEILGDKPTNANEHTFDVGSSSKDKTDNQLNKGGCEDEVDEGSSSSSCNKKEQGSKIKRSNLNTELIKIKKAHYDERSEINKSKEKVHAHYLEEKIKIKNRKLDVLEKKLI